MNAVNHTIDISHPDIGYIGILSDQSTYSTNRHITITIDGYRWSGVYIYFIFSVKWTGDNNTRPIIFQLYQKIYSKETLYKIYKQRDSGYTIGVWDQGSFIRSTLSYVKHDKYCLYYPVVPPGLSVSSPSSTKNTDIPELIQFHPITRCPQPPENSDKIYTFTINVEHLTQSCSGVRFILVIPESEVIYEPPAEMKKEGQPTPGPSVEKVERSITTTQDTEDIDPGSVIDGWPIPVTLTQPTLISKVKLFIASSVMNDTKIVLITSGGTKVALEKRNIRYVVNFSSTGKIGAATAEYFLRHGYFVIYLGSVDSQKPFSRKFKMHTLLDIHDTSGQVKENYRQQMSELITEYEPLKNKLLMLEFDTLPEYFMMLKKLTRMLVVAGSNVMIYLSAAVSDFYIHYTDLPDHKMASGSSIQDLKPVPNVISQLVEDWCPDAFVVTFKLESDPDILMNKARASLNKYKQNVVVCSLLETRYSEVHLLMSSDDDKPVEEEKITVTEDDNIEIESLIVDKLILKHKDYTHDHA